MTPGRWVDFFGVIALAFLLLLLAHAIVRYTSIGWLDLLICLVAAATSYSYIRGGRDADEG